MAEGKKSFVLYADILHTVNKLPDDKAGQLFKLILEYVNDIDPNREVDDLILSIAFEPIKQQLKRDLKRYTAIREKRKEAGKKGAKQKLANLANAKSDKQSLANLAVNVNDNVNVNVNDSVNDSVNDNDINKYDVLLCKLSADSSLLSDQYNKIAFKFYHLFRDNLKRSGISKTTTLDKAKLNSWANEFRLMIERDGRTKAELLNVYSFLEHSDFWAKNIQSPKKLRQQFETIFTNISTLDKPTKQNTDEITAAIISELKE
jgi:hypothetical protein